MKQKFEEMMNMRKTKLTYEILNELNEKNFYFVFMDFNCFNFYKETIPLVFNNNKENNDTIPNLFNVNPETYHGFFIPKTENLTCIMFSDGFLISKNELEILFKVISIIKSSLKLLQMKYIFWEISKTNSDIDLSNKVKLTIIDFINSIVRECKYNQFVDSNISLLIDMLESLVDNISKNEDDEW
jgi:hypothetical protein